MSEGTEMKNKLKQKLIDYKKKQFDRAYGGLENSVELFEAKITEGIVKELCEVIDQLDEPEVLSQEWISENVEYAYFDMLDGSGRLSSATAIIKPKKLQNLLVPKQEEVDRAYKDGYEKGKQHTFYKGYLEGLADKESEPETVADVIADFFKSLERLKEVMSMEIEELEE